MKHTSNILTSLRLLLVPVFPAVYFASHPKSHFIAMCVFLVAGFTDFLDGYIARRYQMVTALGTVLDPLADKLMLLTVLITLNISGTLPLWVVVLIVVKELFMIFAGGFLYFRKSKFVIPSNYFGKAATALLFPAIPIWIMVPGNLISVVLMFSAMFFMMAALLTYIHYYWRRREFL